MCHKYASHRRTGISGAITGGVTSTYGGKVKRPDVVNEWLLLLIRTTSTAPPAP